MPTPRAGVGVERTPRATLQDCLGTLDLHFLAFLCLALCLEPIMGV